MDWSTTRSRSGRRGRRCPRQVPAAPEPAASHRSIVSCCSVQDSARRRREVARWQHSEARARRVARGGQQGGNTTVTLDPDPHAGRNPSGHEPIFAREAAISSSRFTPEYCPVAVMNAPRRSAARPETLSLAPRQRINGTAPPRTGRATRGRSCVSCCSSRAPAAKSLAWLPVYTGDSHVGNCSISVRVECVRSRLAISVLPARRFGLGRPGFILSRGPATCAVSAAIGGRTAQPREPGTEGALP